MKKQDDILGEESDLAICETCDQTQDRDVGVECEGCGGFYCRGICWSSHWCGPLTDRNGREVRIGEVIRYPNTNRVFTVTEILPSFTKSGFCYGERRHIRAENKRFILKPRLMEIIPSENG